jgi:hypothetical protein
MKFVMLSAVMCVTMLSAAVEKKEHSTEEKLIVAALDRLPERLAVKFDIPFPEADIDHWKKQPIALMEVDGGKVAVTQPKMQPYDGSGTIEWMMMPSDSIKPEKAVDCALHLDEAGDFLQIGILCSDDPWSAEDRVNHQISRRDEETGGAFLERAMQTYRLRSNKAKDTVHAARCVALVEKISRAVQLLRILQVKRPAK